MRDWAPWLFLVGFAVLFGSMLYEAVTSSNYELGRCNDVCAERRTDHCETEYAVCAAPDGGYELRRVP